MRSVCAVSVRDQCARSVHAVGAPARVQHPAPPLTESTPSSAGRRFRGGVAPPRSPEGSAAHLWHTQRRRPIRGELEGERRAQEAAGGLGRRAQGA
eukprot:4960394-Prymnesium_polylepis.1